MINYQRDANKQDHLSIAVFRVLKSVAKFALRFGMSAGAMGELLRRACITAAEEILEEDNAKVTTVRVCAMTGLYRKEVRRIENLPPLSTTPSSHKYNKSARVLSAWRNDPAYVTKAGKPAALKPEGENSFESLVRKYSGDMTPVSMKQELERLGLLSITSRNLMKLQPGTFQVSDNSAAMQLLGTDVSDLVTTINHNIETDKNKLFQRKVCYVNIPEQHVEPFFSYATKESQKLLEKLDSWLSNKDYDYTGSEPKGERIGVGIYQIRDTPLASSRKSKLAD